MMERSRVYAYTTSSIIHHSSLQKRGGYTVGNIIVPPSELEHLVLLAQDVVARLVILVAEVENTKAKIRSQKKGEPAPMKTP